jgi:putative nucleotidyltransferase with HDIG domain
MSALLAYNTATATRALALKNVERLPSLSPAVNRLLGLLAKREVDLQLMSRVISSDPSLSGHILNVANSALFNRGTTIKTIDQAVMRLGLTRLRRIALSKSAARIFRGMKTPAEWSMTRFQLHSVAVGAAAEILCEYLPVEDPEMAFLGGLMHDVGKVLIAAGQPDKFREIEDLVGITGRNQIEFERDLLGTDHSELSGMAVAKWELPFLLSRAVARHHDPEEAGEFGTVSLSRILQAADEFANGLGISVRESPAIADAQSEPPALPAISGHAYPCGKFVERFEDEWKVLSAVCF